MFHPYEDISYDSTYLTDISLCLTNRLWNCTWYTSGDHKYDEKTEQYNVKRQGKTVEMWKRRKNNIAALWLDFHVQFSNERISLGDKIAAVGGILGLFLGFSFLGVLDMIYWIVDNCSSCLKLGWKRTEKKTKNKKEYQ